MQISHMCAHMRAGGGACICRGAQGLLGHLVAPSPLLASGICVLTSLFCVLLLWHQLSHGVRFSTLAPQMLGLLSLPRAASACCLQRNDTSFAFPPQQSPASQAQGSNGFQAEGRTAGPSVEVPMDRAGIKAGLRGQHVELCVFLQLAVTATTTEFT